MVQPEAARPRTAATLPATNPGTRPATRNPLVTGDGKISVAESVVQRVAGEACLGVNGVHALSTGGAGALGSFRERIPGSSGPSFGRAIAVEIGDTEAAIDLNIVIVYGFSIAELERSVQRRVQQAVESITGLKVVEVSTVGDIHLPPRTISTRPTPPLHDLSFVRVLPTRYDAVSQPVADDDSRRRRAFIRAHHPDRGGDPDAFISGLQAFGARDRQAEPPRSRVVAFRHRPWPRRLLAALGHRLQPHRTPPRVR